MVGYLGPIRPVRAFERAIVQIAGGIQTGEIAEGDRLPSERDLAAIMEISRPSLRSAIRVFEDSGVVEVRTGSAGGIFVVTSCVPIDLLEPVAPLGAEEVREAFEARRLIEPRIAHLAAVYATQTDYERMQRTIDAQHEILNSADQLSLSDRMISQDVNFHLRLATATHNAAVVEMMQALVAKLAWARASTPQTHEQYLAMIGHHEATLAAVIAADHEHIAATMEAHIAVLEDSWQSASGVQLVRPRPDFMVRGDRHTGRTAP